MKLTLLTLVNFRDHAQRKIDFNDTTIIVGPNASGKTTILEAIYMLAVGRSFRAESDREMIAFGSEYARVVGIVESGGENYELEVVVTAGVVQGKAVVPKRFRRNKVVRNKSKFVGSVKAVLFWPEDLRIVIDSPSVRRTYLDFVLVQVDQKYHKAVSVYERAVRVRNRLLERIREGEVGREQLDYWNTQVVDQGKYITSQREEYVAFLNSQNKGFDGTVFSVEYDKSEISQERLIKYQKEEVWAGKTLVGPHRDNLVFRIKNKELGNEWRDLEKYGSRGEQRLGVLWLKMGELAYVKDKSGELPVLLLDDIFSEFDHSHRKMLFRLTQGQQTIITTTDAHLIEEEYKRKARILEL